MPGARRVTTTDAAAAPAMRIDLNFQRLAIYGLSAADVLDTVQTAFQGRQAAQIYEDGRAVDVAVTAQASIRQDPEGVGELLLRSSSGISVPLKSVANIYLDESRGVIEHDNGVRRRLLLADPAGDTRAFANQARQRLARLSLPTGVYVEVTPPMGADNARLALDVVLAGFAMLALLLLAFGSVRASALVLGSTAFAFVGGVIAVALMGGVLSLGALAGFVTLFGLSTRNAILLVSRVEDLVLQRARPWSAETARLAARQRLLPILTASLLVAAAIAPLTVQAGAPGDEILGPMAVVILGGLLTSALMSLFLSPRLALEMWRPKQPLGDLPASHGG
jgi:Cu/Ag efflux pump CusA